MRFLVPLDILTIMAPASIMTNAIQQPPPPRQRPPQPRQRQPPTPVRPHFQAFAKSVQNWLTRTVSRTADHSVENFSIREQLPIKHFFRQSTRTSGSDLARSMEVTTIPIIITSLRTSFSLVANGLKATVGITKKAASNTKKEKNATMITTASTIITFFASIRTAIAQNLEALEILEIFAKSCQKRLTIRQRQAAKLWEAIFSIHRNRVVILLSWVSWAI